MRGPDRQVEAGALQEFLRCDPARWPLLAPLLVERVGAVRLRQVIDATRERLGGIDSVTDGPEGLVIAGPRGRALAWARTDPEGRLTGLLIAPARRGRWSVPPAVREWAARIALFLLFGFCVADCWSAVDRTAWFGAMLSVMSAYVLFEGYCAPALQPWWIRRTIECGAPVALASAWRLPPLPTGHFTVEPAVRAVVLLACVAALAGSRRGGPRTAVAAALPRFPLSGDWYVVQGAGRGLNHHLGVPPQRGAVDLLRTGAARTRASRSLDSYRAYGAAVHSPCDGLVVAAVDGIEDQVPGVVRFGPVYGNHVRVDTGTEVVTLAHLRPGTVAVADGQRVSAGQLLGEVGNSGNSSEPHLHIHAEREEQGLRLRFADVGGRFYRGRTVRT